MLLHDSVSMQSANSRACKWSLKISSLLTFNQLPYLTIPTLENQSLAPPPLQTERATRQYVQEE